MLKSLSRALFRLQGWEVKGAELSHYRRCVIVGAPHTSNWDMPYTLATFDQFGMPVRFTIKEEWMRFPFDRVIGPAGGIAIDRSPKEEGGDRPSMVEAMIGLFDDPERELALVVTPEATRARVEEWKTGFYYVAEGANVPILLGYVDYAKKETGIGKVIEAGQGLEKTMREMMDFYRTVTPRYEERFCLDQRYV